MKKARGLSVVTYCTLEKDVCFGGRKNIVGYFFTRRTVFLRVGKNRVWLLKNVCYLECEK